MENIEIILTGDGSRSLINHAINETYHSQHGAVRESMHVFIDQGLRYFAARHASASALRIDIFEVGFGTGLNAFLALEFAQQTGCLVSYTTVEAFPLEKKIWSELNYAKDPSGEELFRRLHECAWDEPVGLTGHFTVRKVRGMLQESYPARCAFDLIFFDAFAPNKQPELWEPEVLAHVVDGLRQGGVFVTYSAKGQLKRDLRALSLTVETLPGPPGKKEMTRALKT